MLTNFDSNNENSEDCDIWDTDVLNPSLRGNLSGRVSSIMWPNFKSISTHIREEICLVNIKYVQTLTWAPLISSRREVHLLFSMTRDAILSWIKDTVHSKIWKFLKLDFWFPDKSVSMTNMIYISEEFILLWLYFITLITSCSLCNWRRAVCEFNTSSFDLSSATFLCIVGSD